MAYDDDLMPWHVEPQHLWAFPPRMLRVEARRRAAMDVNSLDADRLASWKKRLKEEGRVVHYDPDTDKGWFYVPARPGIDRDLIRAPGRTTTTRWAAD